MALTVPKTLSSRSKATTKKHSSTTLQKQGNQVNNAKSFSSKKAISKQATLKRAPSRASSFSTTGAQKASVVDDDEDNEVSYVGGTLPTDSDYIMLEAGEDDDDIPELEEVDDEEDEEEDEEEGEDAEAELCMLINSSVL
jgi:hypothetical protein